MLTEYQTAGHDDADLLSPAQVKQFIDTMLATYRFNDEYTAVVHDTDEIRRLNPIDRQILGLIYGAKRLRAKIVDNDVSELVDDLQELATEVKIPIRRGSVNEKIVGREMLRATANYYEVCAHRECKERGLPPPSDLEALSMDDLRHLLRESWEREPSANRQSVPRVLPPARSEPSRTADPQDRPQQNAPSRRTNPNSPASIIWEQFIEDRTVIGKMKEKPHKLRSSLKLWEAQNGDIPLSSWTAVAAEDLRRVFVKLPSNYARSKEWRKCNTLTAIAEKFQEHINAASSEDEQSALRKSGTRHATWNRHQSTLAAFWEWGQRNGYTTVQENPFKNLWIEIDEDDAVEEGGSEMRSRWLTPHLKELFASPLYLGSKSLHRRHVPGHVVERDALYWVVLIAAFTGMRREEICQLRVEHLCFHEAAKIWYFNLKADGLRLKKTKKGDTASKRWVPLPDALLELGIIECLHTGRKPTEQLFTELYASKTYGSYGDKLGQRFGVYRKNYDKIRRKENEENFVPLYARLRDLHSFRTTVINDLLDLGVPQVHAEEIVGHKSEARKTAMANYDHGRTLGILKAAIEKRNLPIDVLRLIDAAARSA
ncbi:integrase [Nitrobacteraceae bacterium AZCC 1564]